MNKRAFWKTRMGFYLAAIASAVGLGNLWRFPYVVTDNGGGAFVFIYVIMAFVIGLPLLVGELIIGKSTRKGIIGAAREMRVFAGKNFLWIARLCLVMTIVILAYYSVISGWVLHFGVQFFKGLVFHDARNAIGMEALLNNGLLQIGLASVHLLFCTIIILKDLEDGFENWISSLMPIFGLLLIILVYRSLSVPSAQDAIRFFLYPDFSKLSLSSLAHAIGHACFTLSVGFGTMITFGSYLHENDHIPTAGFRVAFVDTILSVFAGLLIFPIIFQTNSSPVKDPALLFQSIPSFFVNMPGGILFGFLFFICLYMAALGASLGLMEVLVSNISEQFKMKRAKAAWCAAGVCLLLSTVPAISTNLLEVVDSTMINWVLPLVALGLCWLLLYGLTRAEQEKHFVDPNRMESVVLFPWWRKSLRTLVPGIILAAMILQVVALFN